MNDVFEFGDLYFELLDVKRSCRYCDKYTKYCQENHRSGIWFKLLFENLATHSSYKSNKATIIIGEGESKDIPFDANIGKHLWTGMSGCADYEHAHMTMSEWWQLTSPIVQEYDPATDVKKEYNLTNFERNILIKLLHKNIKDILIQLADKDKISTYEYWGYLETLKPLIKTYLAGKYISLPERAGLDFVPKSFAAKFYWSNITFFTLKAKPKIRQYGKINIIKLGKHRKIYYTNIFNRKVVYYQYFDKLFGYEEYQNHVHPSCEVEYIDSLKYLELLLFNRLGDLLFLTEDNVNFLKENFVHPIVATKTFFKKIKCIQGTIEFSDTTKARPVDNQLTLYHPEHGLLELEPKEYTVYRVPYVRKGHD